MQDILVFSHEYEAKKLPFGPCGLAKTKMKLCVTILRRCKIKKVYCLELRRASAVAQRSIHDLSLALSKRFCKVETL